MAGATVDKDFDELFAEANRQISVANPESIRTLEELMQIAMRDGLPSQFGRAQYLFVFYHCKVTHDHDTAIAICQELLDGIGQNGLGNIIHNLYIFIGNCHFWKGEFEQAQNALLKGARYLESMPVSDNNQKNLAILYSNLAQLIIASDKTDINDDAEKYVKRAIEIMKHYNLTSHIHSSYSIIAYIYYNKKEIPKAIETMLAAANIVRQEDDYKKAAIYYANVAYYHLSLEQYEDAYRNINEALDFYKGQSLDFDSARVNVIYGELLCRTGFLEQGIHELLKAAEVLERFDSKVELMDIYKLLATYMAETGDLESAYKYERKHIEGLTRSVSMDKKITQARREADKDMEATKMEAEALKEKNDEMLKYIGQLEHSNNSLQQFAHITSHDLREPLRMISAYTGLLKKSLDNVLDNEQAEFMEYISGGTKRMQNLINDLLRLAKVGSDPVVEKVDIMEIAEEVKMNIKVLLEEKNAEVDCAAKHTVLADRAMMMQLLQNLIGNGIKYNESAQPSVRIESGIVGNALELRVIDNGIGIPEHLRQKAFELFQRVHTDKQYTGTGIGLAICKKIAETMGGWINIGDSPRGGSIFSVWFPLTAVDMS